MIKQVYELTENDLIENPLWSFLSEDDDKAHDEATVQNCDFNKLPDSVFIVSASFITADGTTYSGYVYGETANEMALVQPNIIIDDKQVAFWYGVAKPENSAIVDIYSRIGKSRKELFPLKWQINIDIENIISSGTIEGFGYYKSFRNKVVRYLK